jgi:putative endonuclease
MVSGTRKDINTIFMLTKQYYVYTLTNHMNTVLYTGVTNDLIRRIYEHKNHLVKGFTDKYQVTKLVYFETTDEIEGAIAREKQIKGGSRQKKIDLINKVNPNWDDLYPSII